MRIKDVPDCYRLPDWQALCRGVHEAGNTALRKSPIMHANCLFHRLGFRVVWKGGNGHEYASGIAAMFPFENGFLRVTGHGRRPSIWLPGVRAELAAFLMMFPMPLPPATEHLNTTWASFPNSGPVTLRRGGRSRGDDYSLAPRFFDRLLGRKGRPNDSVSFGIGRDAATAAWNAAAAWLNEKAGWAVAAVAG